ncbi:VOC family protein [Streptomyces sp. NPDC051219]|uniref:VOC family protein n=1 Tax=Streptomyces sp. NPDC051219 TaxID=3155283 RepID=UPI0034387D50
MADFAEGTPCWVDASLADLGAGRRFYGELFGWTFDEGGGEEYGSYTQAYSDGKKVAALAPKPDGRMPTVWEVYFATPDAAALSARITSAGGQVVMGPMEVRPFGSTAPAADPEGSVLAPIKVRPFGTMALAADPEGAVFGFWQPGTHRGFEKLREPNAYCWTEVYSRDKDRVDPFYEEVFGFIGSDVEDAGIEFRTWSPRGTEPGPETAIGGRSVITDAFPAEMPAHFLVYFNVEDCDASVATVQQLGGRVTAGPFDTPYGRIAVVADNQGAVFALLAEPGRAAGPGTEADAESKGGAGAGSRAGAPAEPRRLSGSR